MLDATVRTVSVLDISDRRSRSRWIIRATISIVRDPWTGLQARGSLDSNDGPVSVTPWAGGLLHHPGL
jgi:hypothetical protein